MEHEHGLQIPPKPEHLVSALQIERPWLEEVYFPLSKIMEEMVDRQRFLDLLPDRRIVIILEEPSTRTAYSLNSGAKLLGIRDVELINNAREVLSLNKGETRYDTRVMFERYRYDLIAWRADNKGGLAEIATDDSTVPIINLGDGAGEHPTQFLLDVDTIREARAAQGKTIDGTRIAIVGNPNSRVTRSWCMGLAKSYDVKFDFVFPHDSLRMGEDVLDYLESQNIPYTESNDVLWAAQKADVLCMTRNQFNHDPRFASLPKEERAKAAEEYYSFRKVYLTQEALDFMHPGSIALHPLPRNNEIPFELTYHPRLLAFTRQPEKGLFGRMALLLIKLAPQKADSLLAHRLANAA